MDTPPRSNHSDDSSNEGSPSSPLDPNMVEGLKCMFQSHRDYLHAVAKNLGVGTIGYDVVLAGQLSLFCRICGYDETGRSVTSSA